MVAAVRFVAAGPDSPEPELHQRLRSAALQLAEASSFDEITADTISARAGISRRTFYRYFTAKEDVLFSDHAAHLASMQHLLSSRSEAPLIAVKSSLELVMNGYLADVNFNFRRDRLVQETPALIDREALWFVEYQQVIGTFLRSDAPSHLNAAYPAVVAAAMVAGLRHTLTEWFSTPRTVKPQAMLTEILDAIIHATAKSRITDDPRDQIGPERAVVVVTTALSPTQIAQLVEAAER